MAKPTAVQLGPEMPFAEAARAVVAVRAADLWASETGVLDTADIERVHDMRVATRRLRAVLEIFAAAFEPRAHRAVLRDVKRLADSLGERRDPDVHIEAMSRMAAEVPPAERPGIQALIGELRARQAAANGVLEAELRRLRERDLPARLEALVR